MHRHMKQMENNVFVRDTPLSIESDVNLLSYNLSSERRPDI